MGVELLMLLVCVALMGVEDWEVDEHVTYLTLMCKTGSFVPSQRVSFLKCRRFVS